MITTRTMVLVRDSPIAHAVRNHDYGHRIKADDGASSSTYPYEAAGSVGFITLSKPCTCTSPAHMLKSTDICRHHRSCSACRICGGFTCSRFERSSNMIPHSAKHRGGQSEPLFNISSILQRCTLPQLIMLNNGRGVVNHSVWQRRSRG